MRDERSEGKLLEEQSQSPHTERLGYLFKHAWLRLSDLVESALAPYGIDGREWAVLLAVGDQDPLSQQQLARRLGIDRTTMVAMVDALEAKGLVERRPDPADRRRNVVEMTGAGRDTLRSATKAGSDAERRFLAPLTEPDARRFKNALRAVIPT